MKKTLFTACCAMLLAGAPAIAGDAAAGKEKSKTCAVCHGADGNSPAPEFPRIAGQHPDYLVKTLLAYKSGARKDPLMAAQAASLSRRDMEDLAAFYSQQKGLVTKY